MSLFHRGTDSSSWNHTREVAVPCVVPDDMPVHHNSRSLVVDSCNRDNRKRAQDASVPGSAVLQDGSSSRVEMALDVACVQV